MKKSKYILSILFFLTCLLNYAQPEPSPKVRFKISGKVIEKAGKQPLEYATITLKNSNNQKVISGGITNEKGEFDIDIIPGIYDISVEFISFKTTEIKKKNIQKSSNIGVIALEEDTSQLKEVIVQSVKSTVEIKLDKKVYNVGQDMTVKGGTASDVLDNVPSVTVDSDGNVSLRGNDKVRILIDGRPTNAINIADALKTISADVLDKIEVITNPSARYDAEGGAGIINIVLKKGINKGINGTLVATTGNPKNYGLNANVNFKSENFNLFSTIGYNNNNAPGMSLNDTNYLNSDGSVLKTINERTDRERNRKGYNYNFGIDWLLDKNLSWINTITYREKNGTDPSNVNSYNYETDNVFVRNRFDNKLSKDVNVEYNTTFIKKFKREGHQFTVDASFSRNKDDESSIITDYIIKQESDKTIESTKNLQTQSRNLFQTDYVLPIGKNGQFEAGYKGDFYTLLTDYNVGDIDSNGNYTSNVNFTNKLDYKEKINALYTQFGSKINKISYLAGLRYEYSNIDINLLTTSNYNNKQYDNFFPSVFLTYQFSDENTFSINYSRRISRPRSRYINPFSNYSSNINIFQGNPDLNPSLTNALDMGYMTKLRKITLSTSIYFNRTKDVFQFIRRPSGEIVTSEVNGQIVKTPVILITPINLSNENRFGFEFNLNYSPYKWWRLNSNFNLFHNKTIGDYSYLDVNNETIAQNFNNSTLGWFTKIASKITLPYKIDWQTNATYNAPQNTPQGKFLGIISANLAFSKDLLKDKATLSLNANDIFNSNKRKTETYIPGVINSYSEFQWRSRQINLSFTYRFNKQKTDKQPKFENGDGDFQG